MQFNVELELHRADRILWLNIELSLVPISGVGLFLLSSFSSYFQVMGAGYFALRPSPEERLRARRIIHGIA